MGQPRPTLAEFDHKRSAAGGYDGAANPHFGKHLTPEMKEKIRIKRLAYIQRTPPELRRVSPETRGIRPNKVEARLIRILQPSLPQFQYNGDYRLGISLDGLIPDFVNSLDKQLLEILGRYWHSRKVIGDDVRRTAEGKLSIYHSLGYKCLVLWDDELVKKSDDEILDSVIQFSRS